MIAPSFFLKLKTSRFDLAPIWPIHINPASLNMSAGQLNLIAWSSLDCSWGELIIQLCLGKHEVKPDWLRLTGNSSKRRPC